MIVNEEKHTTPRQRIVIVAIALFLLVSTGILYVSIVLGSSSSSSTSAKQARYEELLSEYQSKVNAQATELSKQYFDSFVGYKSEVKAFNAADVTVLTTTDLKVGTGAEVTDKTFTKYSAYYIGWLSDETIFDSSLNDTTNPSSLVEPLPGNTSWIEGWKEGIVGMKIGGVRELTIPSTLGYGSTAQGSIPANSPLKFVVMLIDPVTEIEASAELQQLYAELNGSSTSTSTSTTEDTTTSN
jgi:FKBP-type peptidyl-prolyl cis-trans isomerase